MLAGPSAGSETVSPAASVPLPDPPRPPTDRRARGIGLHGVPAFAAMLAQVRWCVWSWRLVSRKDGSTSWTKHPHVPGSPASIRSNSLRGATTYDRAERAVLEGEADGVGWLLLGDLERVWLDGDKCRDPATGVLATWAWALIDRCPGAYVEVTPSGTGIRVMGKANLDVPMQARVSMAGEPGAHERAALEVFFACSRFVTVTGWSGDEPAGGGQRDIGMEAFALWEQGEAQRLARAKVRDDGIAARSARAGPGRTRTAPLEDIAAALGVIANDCEHWDEWTRIGMAAHAASGGDEAAYEAWVAWSGKCEAKHDEEACRERWDHWARSPADRLGFGALAWLAREVEPDWRPPSRTNVDGDFDVVEEARAIGGAEPGKDGEAADGNETGGGVSNGGANSGDAFALLAASLIYVRDQHRWMDTVSGHLLDEPRLRLHAVRLRVPGAMAQGARSLASRLGRPDSGMRWAVTQTMRPGQGVLVEERVGLAANIWRPSALVPLAGAGCADAQPWLEHARRLIPDDADRERVLDRLAWALQHPGRKINSALVLHGGQRTGKDTFLLPFWRALGEHNHTVEQGSRIGGQFNSYMERSWLLISEMPSAHKRDVYEDIKAALATPPNTIRINQKGLREYDIPNILNVVVTSNHGGALALAEDDRRFEVIATVAAVTGDEVAIVFYYAELHHWLEHGGCEAIAGYLLARDVSAFSPHAAPPVTKAKREMIRLGSHPAVIWVTELWEAPSRPLFDRDLVTAGEILAKGQAGLWGAGNAIARGILMAHVVQGLRISSQRWLHTDQRVQDGDVRPRLWALPGRWPLLSQLSVAGLEHHLAEDRKKSMAHDF